jgi:tetratricopeptide (TPR) repeat protein
MRKEEFLTGLLILILVVFVVNFNPAQELFASRESTKTQKDTDVKDTIICPYCGKLITQQGTKEVTGPKSDQPDIPTPKTEYDFDRETNKNTETGNIAEKKNEEIEASPPEIDLLRELFSNIQFILIMSGVLLVILIIVIYFSIIRPRRKRRPLYEALGIIENDSTPEFHRADELLSHVLTIGLKKKDIAAARFAQAYVRSRLKKYSDASATMKELINAVQPDRETVYLNMWLQFQQENYDEVDKIFTQNQELLGDLINTRLIAGIAYLHLGKDHWDRNEIEVAVHFFDKVRKLNVLNQYLPQYIEDHQIVLGIQALYNKSFDEARKHFSGAIETAEKEEKQNFSAKLGLLLCDWIEEDYPDIDKELGLIIETMEKTGAENKDSTGEKEDVTSEKEEPDILLRNVLLWHGVSLIFTWFGLPGKSKLPIEEKEKLKARLNKVKKVDANMGDPYVLEGLIDYYFFYETSRLEAIETLGQAVEKGIHVPEVINLIDREKKLIEHEARALELFLNLLKKYLNDRTIPVKLQEELKEHLRRYSRFKELEKDVLTTQREDEIMPSIKDLQTRGQLLRKRVSNIIKTKIAKISTEDSKNIESLMNHLEKTTETLAQETENLQVTEQKLMLNTGEFLFNEEETLEAAEENPGNEKNEQFESFN